jgi:hypothetical protein
MNFLYALFFSAGVTALAYNKLARRVGYTNGKNVFYLLSAIFIFMFIIFFILISTVVHK